MKARVTITLDPEIHRRAKQQARKKHTTVSGLIESLLAGETSPRKQGLAASLVGSATLKEIPSGSDPLFDTLKSKFIH